ncbi:MAG: transposase, partial [Planctomycetota bacterium]|nr:transposase [Planctomycetota bacterium]
LFEASKETLVALAKEPKYIGSPNIGATAVLHTWGRDLNYYPHLHFIVPGGAIGLDGKSWLSSRVDFLIPVLAASVLATCASERVSKGASFRLRASASQDELGMVVDVGHGDIEHGVRLDRRSQAIDREANVEMSRVWRQVSLPRIRTERTTPLARVRHELTPKRRFEISDFL